MVFALCVAATLLSQKPYTFTWDDADYLSRSIAVSKAFWSADWGLLARVVPGIRPPFMTMLGLPWGPLSCWDMVGKCFLTLAALESLYVALSLLLLLRIGLSPGFLAIGSLCLFAALGPYPAKSVAHQYSTAFMADSFFAWNCLAAVLLIPYEERYPSHSRGDSIRRGLLWGAIATGGAITKASSLYFLGLILPILFAIRWRHSGRSPSWIALVSLIVATSPVILYWLVFGLPALMNGWAASFGRDAPFYHVPFLSFVRFNLKNAPGMLLTVGLAGLVLARVAQKPREGLRGPRLWPLAIMLVYSALALLSSNREIRYLFPGLVSLPYLLLALLDSGEGAGCSRKTSRLAASLVFGFLLVASLPTRYRADRKSFAICEAVGRQAVQLRAGRVLLASDSPSLNLALFEAYVGYSYAAPPFQVDSLACTFGPPIEDDFRKIDQSDVLVIQNKERLNPPWTNTRVPQFEEYVQALGGRTTVVNGVSLYSIPRSR